MSQFINLSLEKSRQGIILAGKFLPSADSPPVAFSVTVMPAWLTVETSGIEDGSRFLESIKAVLGEPARPPSLVKGGSCEVDEESASGSSLSATWEFKPVEREGIRQALSRYFGMVLP